MIADMLLTYLIVCLNATRVAFPNLTRDKNREGLIVRYSPFALKSGLVAIGRKLEACGTLDGRSAMLRQLLGLTLLDGSTNVFG
eukprot:SAG31_NODE_5207_length_2676_cov_2.051610_1_plen_84_part_00